MYRAARWGEIDPRIHVRIRCLHKQQHHEHERGDECSHHRDGPFPQVKRRFSQALGKTDELGRVLVHPGLDVIATDQMADPALAVVDFVDIGREVVGQVGHPVDEGIAECDGQTDEDQNGPRRDDGDGKSTAWHLPALQRHYLRIEHQSDESPHQHQDDDVPQAVEEFGSQIDRRHGGHSDDDGPQGNVLRFRLCNIRARRVWIDDEVASVMTGLGRATVSCSGCIMSLSGLVPPSRWLACMRRAVVLQRQRHADALRREDIGHGVTSWEHSRLVPTSQPQRARATQR